MKFSSRWLVLLTSHISLLTSFSLAPLLLVTPAVVHAQWEPEVRLTCHDTLSQYVTTPSSVAAQGDTVHLIWIDYLHNMVLYKRSTDKGVSWSANFTLINDPYSSQFAALAASPQGIVHVFWLSSPVRYSDIFYKRSTDGGTTWSSDTNLTNDPGISQHPSIAVSGSRVHLVWNDISTLSHEMCYKGSLDGGASWGPTVRLTSDTVSAGYPSVASSGPNVHVVWCESRHSIPVIRYKRSTDGGASWGATTILPTQSSGVPSLAASDSAVHMVWSFYDSTGESKCRYKRSRDGGATWEVDANLTSCDSVSDSPVIVATGPNVHAVWIDYRVHAQVYYRRSTDRGSDWEADTVLSSAASLTRWIPSIAVSGPAIHVVCCGDTGNSVWEIYYMRNLTGNTGVKESSGSFKSLNSNLSFSVVPNPFFSFASVPGHSSERFALYDISGRRVGAYKGARIGEGLAAGVYFLKSEGKDAKPLRIIKLR